jgi:hypothetical protein
MASPNMNPGGWSAGVSPTTGIVDQSARVQRTQARVVQHHYVRAQLREINLRNGDALVEATLQALRQTVPGGRKCTREQLLQAFSVLTTRLQKADLTINIKAPSWFTTPNNYDSYAQMYERAVRKLNIPGQPGVHQMRLSDADAKNPAATRVAADHQATFGSRMLGNGGQFKGSFGGIGRVMATGGLATPAVDAKDGELIATNPYFNPKSKQVFAALNYGGRPHGATTTYGFSYLVLKPKFKTNAIYFAGDTFCNGFPDLKVNVSANDQVSYELLGAIYAKASVHLREDIYKSCLLQTRLPDAMPSNELQLLLEAHLFERITFSGNLEAVVISELDRGGTSPQEWATIQVNARAFASKHGARLSVIA